MSGSKLKMNVMKQVLMVCNENYGKNFEIGGKLDILTRSFLDRLGDITTHKGYYCVD